MFDKEKSMFNFLKPKNKTQKLEAKYRKLLDESYKLSKIDRKKADQKMAEAEKVLAEIDKLSSN